MRSEMANTNGAEVQLTRVSAQLPGVELISRTFIPSSLMRSLPESRSPSGT